MELKLTNKTNQNQPITIFKKGKKDDEIVKEGCELIIKKSDIHPSELERAKKFFTIEEVKKPQPVSFSSKSDKPKGDN